MPHAKHFVAEKFLESLGACNKARLRWLGGYGPQNGGGGGGGSSKHPGGATAMASFSSVCLR